MTPTSDVPSTPATQNIAPTISGTPTATAAVGSSYSFTPSASDANGDRLVFTSTNLPGWLSFDSTTGKISGKPTAGQAGAYSGITITVSDGIASATLPAFSVQVVVTTGTSSARLNWTPPAKNTDGSAATDITGYMIYYGTSGDDMSRSMRVDGVSTTSATVSGLTSGTWYFGVTALSSSGAESALSGIVSGPVS